MKGATSIQERLWELRKDKGLNLEELSKLTGISKSALGSYEKEDYKEINHGNTSTEPVRPFLSGKLLQLVLQCLFIIDGFPQFLFAFLQLPVELSQL